MWCVATEWWIMWCICQTGTMAELWRESLHWQEARKSRRRCLCSQQIQPAGQRWYSLQPCCTWHQAYAVSHHSLCPPTHLPVNPHVCLFIHPCLPVCPHVCSSGCLPLVFFFFFVWILLEAGYLSQNLWMWFIKHIDSLLFVLMNERRKENLYMVHKKVLKIMHVHSNTQMLSGAKK